MSYSYLVKTDSVVIINHEIGKSTTASRTTHANFDQILDAVKAKDYTTAEILMDKKMLVINFLEKNVSNGKEVLTLRNGEVYQTVDGVETVVHNAITRRIVTMAEEGFDVEPMLLFLGNLGDNPSKTAIEELYGFMDVNDLPVTEEGCFLAYKKVRRDWKDHHSGTILNKPGMVVKMKRGDVDDNRDRTCSSGLHFCSKEYLPHFGGDDRTSRVVIVKINPRDVVSIPSDYNNAKGRCCMYEVVAEYTGDWGQDAFKKSVVSVHKTAASGVQWSDEDKSGKYYFDTKCNRWRDADTNQFVSNKQVRDAQLGYI